MKLSDNKYRELVLAANSARGGSYSPYSHFAVGAALLAEDGKGGYNVYKFTDLLAKPFKFK